VKAFADLYNALDETTKTNEKVESLRDYFSKASPADAAWALYFLSGRTLRQVIPSRKLHSWAVEAAGIPEWLYGESYDAVGDAAETITLLLPDSPTSSDLPLHEWVESRLIPLRNMDEQTQHETMLTAWHELDRRQRFVWNKLITGAFRVGVSQLLIIRALSDLSGIDRPVVAHRMMGAWEPTPDFFTQLIASDTTGADISRPYPFCLAYAIEEDLRTLGDVNDFQVEWKWDGIRSQLIRRSGKTFLWSRGEELITEGFPEIAALGDLLPEGTVIDGEILPWMDDGVTNGVMPFAQLQRRIGRKKLGKKILAEVPVILMAYDLLEQNGADVRTQPMTWRREQLTALVNTMKQPVLRLSPTVQAVTWDDLANSREKSREINAEGLMLKRRDSAYLAGRHRGSWWKWKINPYTVDAVLIYAQRGSGKRASLYTDYTFGVWYGDHLVTFAKAYSGLTDAEINKVDAFVRQNTLEKFGPVRTVTPQLVFELAFEGIQLSSRHKSGIAVRFPRILRWRIDKTIQDADSLETIRAMLPKSDVG
jgi:DNA ligase-1